MKVTTRVFGEIDIADDKIIHFQGGSPVRWMQSLQEPNFAMPVMDPLAVCPDYNPVVEDEVLKPIGEFDPESVLVLVTLTVPKDVKKMSVNLQAPFVINADEKKACQIIVDSEKYPVRFPIYDIIKKED